MASASGVMQNQRESCVDSLEATPIDCEQLDVNQGDQFKMISIKSKRTRNDDDSFEKEHRLAPKPNQYFNNNTNRLTTNSSYMLKSNACPPFKLVFLHDETPSELAIIKDVNKACKISLSYGRFAQTGNK